MTDPTQHEPFAAPYVLNPSSSGVLNEYDAWPTPQPWPPRPPHGGGRWIVPVVILTVVVLIGGLVTGFVIELHAIAQRANDSGRQAHGAPEPFIEPTQAPPAPTPSALSFTCTHGCLSPSSAALMIPNGSLQLSMPLNELSESPSVNPTTASAEYQADTAAWNNAPPADSTCFFIDSRSPVSPARNGLDWTSEDPVAVLGKNVDRGGSSITQTARFFSSPGLATDQMNWMRHQVTACNAIDPTIESASAFQLPSDMTVVTFVADEDDATIYTYDFQRANAVVRFRVVTHDHVDENKVRHFLGTWALTDFEQLALN